MHFAIFVACLVANILANRACSLRLSNIFIATSIWCIILYTFSGTFVNDILQSSAWGYYLQDFISMFYKINMVYRDFITMLIFGYYALPSHQFSHLVELLLVRYGNASLRLFCTRFTWFTEILSHC